MQKKSLWHGTIALDACCWRENVKPLQYFCSSLPVSYHSQRKLLFWKKIYWSDNTVLLSMSRFIYNAFIDIGTNFGVISPKLSDSAIKELVWNSFATSVKL